MVRRLCSTKENLKNPPQFTALPIKQVTLGDLHANAMKLIHTLVRYGVCDIEVNAFDDLQRLYHKKDPTEEGKKAFLKLITDALQVKNKEILVRLIGDIVADRGKNDLYVLAILEKLRLEGVSVSTLVSNHDIELIFAYEAYKKNGGILDRRLEAGVRYDQKTSLLGLAESIGQGKVCSKERFEQFMENDYLPTLKLLDYSLSENDPKHITIFSHAPVDLEVIEYMSKKFGVSHRAKTVEALTQTIDEINRKFVACVRDGNVGLIYDDSKIGNSGYSILKENCVEYAIWNRTEDLNAGSKAISADHISFVYGHTMGESHQRENVVKVDNVLGKVDGLHRGIDPVFVSTEPLPKLKYATCDASEYITPAILVSLKKRIKARLVHNPANYFVEKRAELTDLLKLGQEERKSLDSATSPQAIETLDASLDVMMDRINACIYFQIHDKPNTLEAEKNVLIAEFGIFDEDLIEKILSVDLSEAFIPVINDALLVLKDYSAGTAVHDNIQSIQDDMDKKDFKAAILKMDSLNKNRFEGLGARAIDADKRGVCEKAWYSIISGIRFFLGLVTSIFTKYSNHENSLAKSLFGQSFFFQKPFTKGEKELITTELEQLEEAKGALVDAMNASDKPGLQ